MKTKTFDCVQLKDEVQKRYREQTVRMTDEEERAWSRKRASEVLQRLKAGKVKSTPLE